MDEEIIFEDGIDPYTYLVLPLHKDPDYYYVVNLEGIAYKLRFYYNTKEKVWALDVRYANNDPIMMSVPLIPNYPIFQDYEMPFSGFFYLGAVGKEQNETTNNPFEIWKYYKLYYGYLET